MVYTIREVAKKTSIPAHTLRFYEKEGIMPGIERDDNGNRVYGDQDLEWLDFVLCLRSIGLPLVGIKHYLELYRQGDCTIPKRREMIQSHKAKIERQMKQLSNYLEKINYKMALYDVQEQKLKGLP